LRLEADWGLLHFEGLSAGSGIGLPSQ